MNVTRYLHLVPQIQEEIERHRLDAIVCGMGPTAWLLRYVSRAATSGVRLWGCHDGCRILPMDDLVIMDPPVKMLHPDTTRHQHIIEARPKRLWIYHGHAKAWEPLLPQALKDVTKEVPMGVWPPDRTPLNARFKLVHDPIHTIAISPTGMTTLAWREGCRRIGVIGADMMKNHHHTHAFHQVVDAFFAKLAQQAHELGGCLVNLSPISALQKFRTWTPSASSSAPTDSNATTEPNSSSPTASASTAPAPSRSTSCEAETQDSRSASTAIPEPGR